ncbi:MAG: RNA-guided pseudouridylation complex pseudouridine synthase subunit Cbf5 [Candidatus Aenigmarchaeota archaeon]|nr:RNA-guided pseudouridylation complex pseudouridine synthase subunit Cbf5 [Candidatus Aenigmarchaeota archaeon]
MQKWIIKKPNEETNWKYGCLPHKRKIEDLLENGIVVVNKHNGPTSHDIVDLTKKVLNVEKAGHSGTLDPIVCGVLPVTLNNATKMVSLISKQGKQYVCVMHLHQEENERVIKNALLDFVGVVRQMPPVKSAVKREWRNRWVYNIKIIEIKKKDVLFRASVEAGFYMRKLCSDVGEQIGCGANMGKLIRTRAGPFELKDSFCLDEINKIYQNYIKTKDEKDLRKIILPMEDGLKNTPKIVVGDKAIYSICNGVPLYPPAVVKFTDDIKKGDYVAILSVKGEFVAIGESFLDSDDLIKVKNKTVASIQRVLMDVDTYKGISHKGAAL